MHHGVILLGLMVLWSLLGCTGKSTTDWANGAQPDWVQDLREPIADLPTVFPSAATIDTVEANNPLRPVLGEPRDLTQPLTEGDERLNAGSGPYQGWSSSGYTSGEIGFDPDDRIEGVILDWLESQENPDAALALIRESELDFAPIEAGDSLLEAMYAGETPQRPGRRLTQFGYDHFDQRRVRLTLTEMDSGRGMSRDVPAFGPPPGDYVIGPGDELVVSITGREVAQNRLTVDASGQIMIEEVGPVSVAGLQFGAVEEHIRKQVAKVVRNFELGVTMGRLRGLRIRVTGEIDEPGDRILPSQSTLLDALAASGIKRSGSLRRITLRRPGQEDREIDLYGYLVHGRTDLDMVLQTDDLIHIPTIGPTFGVAGSVQRPSIYELLPDRAVSVGAALEVAGGMTAFTINDQMQVERTDNGRRILMDLDVDPESQSLQNGDLLFVGAVDGRLHPVVEVVGEVARAGRYQHRDAMTVSDLVRLAGGITLQAYGRQAFISRQVGLEEDRNLGYAAEPEPTQRRVMVIDLDLALQGHPEHDVELLPLDLLQVIQPEAAYEVPTVEILGAVRRPGHYEVTAGLRVSELIALAGNFEPDAFRDEAELIRQSYDSDRESLDVERFRLDLRAAADGSGTDPMIRTGDRLIVRRLTQTETRVRIEGQVRFPGEYVLPSGAQITDLLQAAGGILDDGNLHAAMFTRRSVRQQQQDHWDNLIERTVQTVDRNLAQRISDSSSREVASAQIQSMQAVEFLGRLRRRQATGRIVVPLASDDFPESSHNMVLEPGDRLLIPRMSNTVTIAGHVYNPVTVAYTDGMTAEDLLEQSGGFDEIADKRRLFVIRADGTVANASQRFGRFELEEPLRPGDAIMVPHRPLPRDPYSQINDVLMLARTAAQAGTLWRAVAGDVEDLNVSFGPGGSTGSQAFSDQIIRQNAE